MQIIKETEGLQLDANVATIGFFDGVHIGHRFLLEQVKHEALKRGLSSSVITFPTHPGKIVNPNRHIDHITLSAEKIELLQELELDYCFLLQFSKELSRYSAKEFMRSVLKDKFNVHVLVIGYDHRFGYNREDGFNEYVAYGKELGIELIQAREYRGDEGALVSSSYIRDEIRSGNIEEVNGQLGYPYFLNGEVIHGKKLGRTIGFPTANIQVLNGDKMVPKDGVYAVKVHIEGDEKSYGGMLNIGHRPTINNGCNRSIEVHILDFSGDIYGKKMRLTFLKRMRSEVKFETIEGLVNQLNKDECAVRAFLNNTMCNCL